MNQALRAPTNPAEAPEPLVSNAEDLARALRAAPDTAMNWHRYGMALAEGDDVPALLDLADEAAPRFGSGVRFFQSIVLHFYSRGRWEVIRKLERAVPRERLEYPVALYYTGCEKVESGDHEAALEIFDAFKRIVVPNHKAYPVATDRNFSVIFRQGTLVESVANTELILAQPPAKVPSDLTVAERAPLLGSSFVITITLDARYFARFASLLCLGFELLGVTEPVHFHVVAPRPDTYSLFEKFKNDHAGLSLGLSCEEPGPWCHPVYYTCARLFAIERLLSEYDRTVLALDADSLPVLSPGAFVEGAGDADFACFNTGRAEPASVYAAGIMVFPNRPATLGYLSMLQRFVTPKLDQPPFTSWMLDQAAMFSVLTFLAKTKPSFRHTDLGKATGQSLGELTRQLSTEAEKNAIMNGKQ